MNGKYQLLVYVEEISCKGGNEPPGFLKAN